MERVLADPHKAAALAYGVLGVVVILITFAGGLVPVTRADANETLLIGGVFVLLFTVLLWRGWWPLSAFLVFTNLWRATNFMKAGLRSEPVAFINAALMAVIVLLLARSAWIGFSAWHTRRQIEREA